MNDVILSVFTSTFIDKSEVLLYAIQYYFPLIDTTNSIVPKDKRILLKTNKENRLLHGEAVQVAYTFVCKMATAQTQASRCAV